MAQGPKKNSDEQLDLFAFKQNRYDSNQTNHTDAIRTDGGETLARVSPEHGGRNGSQRRASGNALGSGGEDGERNARLDDAIPETGIDGAASARPRLGDREGTLHSPAGGSDRDGERVVRNPNNYRILPADGVGAGSLREKCRANLAAIKLLRQLQADNRPATHEEKSALVRYVGWGGLSQIFSPATDWQKENLELSTLLSEEEFRAARASTLNAHYTSGEVIQAMYAAAERLGFNGGRILEPSCGIGHFIGFMPEAVHSESLITGIEIDPLTAQIAKALYPDADIRNEPFEKANVADGFYDLAISNIPFGDYKPFDNKFNRQGFLIHDYFFARGIEAVRPGGLMMFVTSRGTMDKIDNSLRRYVAAEADLIGAIRLPNTAFKRNANTEVTTDILILKKRRPLEMAKGESWTETVDYTNASGETFRLNEYFARHPHMMLGEMRLEGRMYSRNEPTLADAGQDLKTALADAVKKLPANIYQPLNRSQGLDAADQSIPAPGDVKPNAYTIHEDEISIREGNELIPLPHLPTQTKLRIRGLIQVRDAVRQCLRTQLADADEDEIKLARQQLNQTYDRFSKRFGAVSERANALAFRGDPDLPLLFSLENYDTETKQATKTTIFRERTVHRQKPVTAVQSPKEAIIVSLNEKGRVDLEHIAKLLDRPAEEFLPELKGVLYLNPQTQAWETEDHYLSGDVRDKLRIAEAASLAEPRFQENVAALKSVQPEDLPSSEIDVRLGVSWVSPKDYEKFARELLGADDIKVSYVIPLGTWLVKAEPLTKRSVANTTEWGTDRATALELLEDALNLRTPTIYDTVKENNKTKQVVNPTATEGVREKQQKIKDRFKEWIWQDDERRERLAKKYNEEFNSVRLRVFNGEHLTLPGASQAIQLQSHQKTGVWRIVQTPNTLLGHVVGAGKTFTMVAAGMELKRLGLARKPLFAVPNHMLGQFSSELLMLYPGANILAATKEDFAKDKRRELMSRIATGNWDAVIVTHSGFEKLPMSEDYQRTVIQEQVDELAKVLQEMGNDPDERRTVKQLESAKKKLEAKLESLANNDKKDNTLTFEELGVDRIFIDEAHYYKNLFYITKMTRIAGLPQTASARAFDMYLKTRYIQEANGGGGVVFATGTPIANSVAEMFTMQRYLQMGTLRKQDVHHFDNWAATFGETVTAMELSPDGGGYRLNTRFARFVNVPELMQMFCQMADIQTAATLKLPVPGLHSGKPEIIRAPNTPELKTIVQELVQRAEKIRGGKVHPAIDNMLKITSEGRKAALDLRVLNAGANDQPNSKINLAADKIFQIWQDTHENRCAQLVFCDLSTPSKLRRQFSAYDELKDKLIARGVPDAEIAFMQDYDSDTQKLALFKQVRSGTVRVLMGSTQKMGAGTNVQERLVALHHLDAPWRPADVEQREGRILRQGNQNKTVHVFRYVTEGSFDAYMWQTLETKAKFIHQVMTGNTHVRHIEDVDSRALTYAEVKAIASGNPLVIEKASVDAEVMRLHRLRYQHGNTQDRIRSQLRKLVDQIPLSQQFIENMKLDMTQRIDTHSDAFQIQLEKSTHKDRGIAGELLLRIVRRVSGEHHHFVVGAFAGFELSVRSSQYGNPEFILKGKNHYSVNAVETPLGMIRSLEYLVQNMESELAEKQGELVNAEKQRDELKEKVGQPFEHEAKLQSLLARQDELDKKLDITKNQAASSLAAEATEPAVEVESEDETESVENEVKVTPARATLPEIIAANKGHISVVRVGF
jgi:N12 class adenine-specific DNA methylase